MVLIASNALAAVEKTNPVYPYIDPISLSNNKCGVKLPRKPLGPHAPNPYFLRYLIKYGNDTFVEYLAHACLTY